MLLLGDRATLDPGITGTLGCTLKLQEFAVAQVTSIYGVIRVRPRLGSDALGDAI
jgi:hypothetical protein